MTFTHRLGNFFTIVGAALVALFVISDLGDQPAFGYFFFGLVTVVLGLYLRWRSPNQPAAPAGRFTIIKRMRERKAVKPTKPTFRLPSFKRSTPPPQNLSSQSEQTSGGSKTSSNTSSKTDTKSKKK
ncbi:MAG: hypothetical protein JW987_06950 [Anaerolineaceae bacterium]|nr:hypothetical protein [Anaerolineaceae bacterium]